MFPLARLGLLGLLAGAAFVFALEREAPLFLNLGPGDEPFARGFRSGWERDGLRGAGETLFRWTEDGARLEIPVVLGGAGRVQVRLRLARFLDAPVDMSLFVGDRLVDRWTQAPAKWMVRTVDLGAVSGPLQLRFRSTAADPKDPLGVALDWVEVRGAGRIRPRSALLPGLLCLFVGLPLLVAAALGNAAGAGSLLMLAAGGALALGLDRLGALVALANAGLPALFCGSVLVLAARWLLGRPASAGPLGLAIVVSTLALVALLHPGYHYPDVDTHARYLQAIRRDPVLAWDATPYQARTGAWTREVAGNKLAFPYSPAFHLLAWPMALAVGDFAAVKTLAAVALGASMLLAFALVAAAGLPPRQALLAPAILALLPVTSSRLSLALWPTLLGQACELLLVVALARGLCGSPPMGDRRLLLLLMLAQAAYTASVFNVAAFAGALALLLAMAGQRTEAGRLLALWALAAVLVVAALYGRFLPTLWRDVLPNLGEAGASAAVAEGPWPLAAARRLGIFYDLVYPILVGFGLVALRGTRTPAWRVLTAVLLGGLALLTLRFLAPALFRDAKEVEMLAPAVAVLSALAVAWLLRGGRMGRAAAFASLAWMMVLGIARGAATYAERFVAVGR